MTNQELGENVRKIRELKGFSQQNLADEIKVDQKTISRIEKGDLSPKFETLVAISKALCKLNNENRQILSKNSLLLRDSRIKESKKCTFLKFYPRHDGELFKTGDYFYFNVAHFQRNFNCGSVNLFAVL
jgi:transcriptional regulator with XRE-family HTH domain